MEHEHQSRDWEHKQEAERAEQAWAAHQQASAAEYQRRVQKLETEVRHARRETRWAQSMAVAASNSRPLDASLLSAGPAPAGSPITPGAVKWGDQMASLDRKLASRKIN